MKLGTRPLLLTGWWISTNTQGNCTCSQKSNQTKRWAKQKSVDWVLLRSVADEIALEPMKSNALIFCGTQEDCAQGSNWAPPTTTTNRSPIEGYGYPVRKLSNIEYKAWTGNGCWAGQQCNARQNTQYHQRNCLTKPQPNNAQTQTHTPTQRHTHAHTIIRNHCHHYNCAAVDAVCAPPNEVERRAHDASQICFKRMRTTNINCNIQYICVYDAYAEAYKRDRHWCVSESRRLIWCAECTQNSVAAMHARAHSAIVWDKHGAKGGWFTKMRREPSGKMWRRSTEMSIVLVRSVLSRVVLCCRQYVIAILISGYAGNAESDYENTIPDKFKCDYWTWLSCRQSLELLRVALV